MAVYHGQKVGKWKEICRRILLHWKKVVPLHHCKRRKRLCETFREGKKGKGAHSSAGLEHLSYKQRVIGSNPIGPTPLQRTKALPHREQIITIITLFGEGS